jgi:hypothetical protein
MASLASWSDFSSEKSPSVVTSPNADSHDDMFKLGRGNVVEVECAFSGSDESCSCLPTPRSLTGGRHSAISSGQHRHFSPEKAFKSSTPFTQKAKHP